MRDFAAGVLLVLGALLAVSANVGVWVDRTVFDTDEFVSTTDAILEDEHVRLAIADRFVEEIFAKNDIEGRIRDSLPEGLQFLAPQASRVVRELIIEAALLVLDSDALRTVRNEALRVFHTLLIAIIEDETGTLSVRDNTLVLDLKPVLAKVAEEVGLQQGRLLGNLELPEDAGRFVIQDESIAWAYRLVRFGRELVVATVAVAATLIALSVAMGTDRRKALRNAGYAIGTVSLISLALLLPIRRALSEFADNPDAAKSVFDILTAGLREQSLIMLAGGLLLAGTAGLAGETRVAVAVRRELRRGLAGERPALLELIRERTTAFRIAGFVVAALALIAWPDPTTRTYVTILLLSSLYFSALAVATSETGWATAARKQLGDLWARYFRARPPIEPSDVSLRGWIASHAGWLRAAGIAVAIPLLIAWPGLSLGAVVAVIAIGFLYLAGIDLVADRAGS